MELIHFHREPNCSPSYIWRPMFSKGWMGNSSPKDTVSHALCVSHPQHCLEYSRIQDRTDKHVVSTPCAPSICERTTTLISCSFPSTAKQIFRYSSDRTGIISFANFPLIWLFGMRNNLLMWLTGWDFGTYNNFHRWVARIATLQAILHSIGYSILVYLGMPPFEMKRSNADV